MRYMLDTNACIHIIKKQPDSIVRKLKRIRVEQIGISGIVVAELAYGIRQSERRKQNQEAVEEFLSYVLVEDWPAAAAKEYGNIRTHLQNKGMPIGAMDLLIAAHAMYNKSILVTDNLKEFKRIPGLKIENWVA